MSTHMFLWRTIGNYPLIITNYPHLFHCIEAPGSLHTVMILSFRTDMPGQTVQTQIRLLLEEQSAPRGAVCFERSSLIRVCTICSSLCIFWMHYSIEKPSCSTFRVITANFPVSEILGFLRYSAGRMAVYFRP